MKKEYVRPMMISEAFVANEYVATCYSGVCDVNCDKFYIWDDKNSNGKYDSGESGHKVGDSNWGCKQSFNADGKITPVVWFEYEAVGFLEWDEVPYTGWYFIGPNYYNPKETSTHVTTSYKVTNAS